MENWSKTFTQIDNVNSGREVGLNDVPTPEMFNTALNNTQYLYDLLNAGFIDSIQVINNQMVVNKKKADGTVTTTTISITDLNGYTKTQIDTMFDDVDSRLTNLGFRYPSTSQNYGLNVEGEGVAIGVTVNAGANGNRNGTSREGNRTILNLNINFYSGIYRRLYDNGGTAQSSYAIPVEYRPKENYTFYVSTGNVNYSISGVQNTINIPLIMEMTILTTGYITARVSSFPSGVSLTYNTNNSKNTSIKIGYYCNPISS